jgi:hypothetical protein
MDVRGKLACIATVAFVSVITPAMAQSPTTQFVHNSNARMTPMRPISHDRTSTATAAPVNAAAQAIVSRAPRKHSQDHKDHKQKAKIDSLDVELRHDGCFWAVEIEYEVELEGFADDDVIILGLELLEDDKPVLDGDGKPMAFVLDLGEPKKDKKGKREYEGRVQIRVHKDWVKDDDDLELKASLVREADGRVLDVEEESADQDRPGPVLHIGAYGIGISIPL